MKNLVAILFVLSIIGRINAQEVGLRVGGLNGNWGIAIDGVFDAGVSRMHVDLGYYMGGVEADVLWDLVYEPLPYVESLYGYIGIGSSVRVANPFLLGVAGEVGFEYRFANVPIVIGGDWRPTFWLLENTEFTAGRWGINARWNFGKQ
jgi:hypothetical protein